MEEGLFFLEELLQVSEAVDGDVVALGLHFAPDGGGPGDDFDIGGEGFDDDIALVADGFEGGNDGFPVDMIATWGAAVAPAGMEVGEEGAGFEDGGGLIFLLDIHVEGIEVEANGLAADGFDEFDALVAGIEEIGFETIEGFDAELDTLGLGVFCERFEIFDNEIELGFFLGVVVWSDEADDGVEWSDDRWALHDDGLVDEATDVIGGDFLFRWGATEVAAWAHAGADRADFDPGFIGGGFDFSGVGVFEGFDGNFCGIEAPFLEFGEEFGGLIGGEGAGVEEGIESEAHKVRVWSNLGNEVGIFVVNGGAESSLMVSLILGRGMG